MRIGALEKATSIVADGGEFFGSAAIKRVGGSGEHCTGARAYASWEKGSVENAGRMVRWRSLKGIDFSTCSKAEIALRARTITAISRLSPNGMFVEVFHATAAAA